MFNTAGPHHLKLRWKSQDRKTLKDGTSKIIYENIKEDNRSLKDFIIKERANNAVIYLDFLIDGVDFAFWLNLNYYTRRVIGTDYHNMLPYYYNYHQKQFHEVNVPYQKIYLKRILGQYVTIEDSIAAQRFYPSTLHIDEHRKRAKDLVQEENQDTILYTGYGGDRLSGYFGIKVYHTEKHIIWQTRLYRNLTVFKFDKQNYFEAFKEYIDLINNELQKIGLERINIEEEGEPLLTIKEKVVNLKSKYRIKEEDYNVETLHHIFQQGTIEEIDAALYLADLLNFDLFEIKENMERDYEALSSSEKNSMSWKISDTRERISNLDLSYSIFTPKAYLLYNKLHDE